MIDPQVMYDLINSYNQTMMKAKSIQKDLKDSSDASVEAVEAQEKLEKAINAMEGVEELLFQVRLFSEIVEAKENGFDEEVEVFNEMLKEF